MDWDVTDVQIVDHGVLRARFRDGTEGRVRFADSAFSGVFAKLRDPLEFDKAFIDGYFVSWPGQLDLAPDAMHAAIRSTGECVLA